MMMRTQSRAPARNAEAELHQWAGELYENPLQWVREAFPWKQPGPLQAYAEPDRWQLEFLEWLGDEIKARAFDGVHPVMPIRAAVSSGHGIGKGALTGMLVAFLMSTRRNAKGTITANTSDQLDKKTWASVQIWVQRCITAHWFELNTSIVYRKGFRAHWHCEPLTCDPDNAEAFQGQHAADSTSFYIFDEDSTVPESIHEAATWGLTDGEPMMFLFGNPTRRRGTFYETIFEEKHPGWKTWIIDARTCRHPNKEFIADQLIEYGGEDSDRFRVRVRGLPPRAEDAQFIDSGRVTAAQKRVVAVLPDEPLVAGCDLAWGGADANVIRFRRGRDAKSIPPIRIPGELTRDPAVLTNRLADVLSRTYGTDNTPVTMLFLDSAGIAGPVAGRLREAGFTNVREVNFGADSPDPKCRFMRDYMWEKMKTWLLTGAIDNSPRLETDLTGPGLREDLKQRIWLESKKEMKARDVDSPDEGDALALTFSQQVRVTTAPGKPKGGWLPVSQSWQG